jgi:fibronectin type 3 domain-containing protein
MILNCCVNLGFAQGIRGSVKLTGKAAIVTTGHSVTLSWNATQGATSYCIYRGTTHGGPYVKIASGIIGTNYVDVEVTHNRTFYYATTALGAAAKAATATRLSL